MVSLLTKVIEETKIDNNNGVGLDKEGLPLTVYLPDFNSLTVYVKESSDFCGVIKQILITHERQGLLPPLTYCNPENYELRIHEGSHVKLFGMFDVFESNII